MKPRINKFIFREGDVFLRLKVTAKEVKVKKVGSDYELAFNVGSENKGITVPVVLIEEFQFPETILEQVADITAEDISAKSYRAGRLISLKAEAKKLEQYYYLSPKKQDFAVLVGPVPMDIKASDLEMDWERANWGMS